MKRVLVGGLAAVSLASAFKIDQLENSKASLVRDKRSTLGSFLGISSLKDADSQFLQECGSSPCDYEEMHELYVKFKTDDQILELYYQQDMLRNPCKYHNCIKAHTLVKQRKGDESCQCLCLPEYTGKFCEKSMNQRDLKDILRSQAYGHPGTIVDESLRVNDVDDLNNPENGRIRLNQDEDEDDLEDDGFDLENFEDDEGWGGDDEDNEDEEDDDDEDED